MYACTAHLKTNVEASRVGKDTPARVFIKLHVWRVMLRTLCLSPRCPNLATKTTRCDLHAAPILAERRQSKRFYSSTTWRKKRAAYLKAHPWCTEPGCTAPSTAVDHVLSLRNGGADDESNYRAYCRPHASKATVTKGEVWAR
jgi:hypothetical protein